MTWIVSRYSHSTSRVTIELRVQRDGKEKWAVCDCGLCLAKDGLWEVEPNPSNREDDFLERCRFDSLEDAFAAAESDAKVQSSVTSV